MNKKKIFSILLTAAVAVSVMSGCKKTTPTSETTKPDDKSPVTFTIFQNGAQDDDFTNPVAKEITKRTGVTLKIEHAVDGDNNRVPLMIASHDYPDMIYTEGNASKLVTAGALVKLDDYINKEGKNVQSIFGNYLKRLKYSPEDPSIYYLGAFSVDSANWQVSGPMQIQNAVLKDQGYPDVRKWKLQDFENAIKAYKDKYPKIDGNDTIGLSLCADDWRWLITVGNPAGQVAGFRDDGQWAVDHDTNTATYKFLTPEVKQYFQWLNHMNSIGLLDKDSFSQKYDAYKAKLTTGRVLATADAIWDQMESMTSLVAAKKEDRTLFQLPVKLNDGAKIASLASPGYIGSAGMAITTACKDPERAFKFLDWMCSDEAQVLNYWGIEGVNYKVENGKRVIPDDELQKKTTDKDYAKKTGVGLYGNLGFPGRGDGIKDPTGNTYTTNTQESIAQKYNAAEKETVKAYGVKLEADLFPQTSEFKIPPFGAAWGITIPQGSDLELINKKIDECSQKTLPAIVLSDPSKFDELWNKYQDNLKTLGAEKAGQLMTKLIKDKIDFWK